MIQKLMSATMKFILRMFIMKLLILKMIIRKIAALMGCSGGGEGQGMIVKGIVTVTRKKNAIGFNDFISSICDGVGELLGHTISLQLVSATVSDPNNKNKGVIGEPAQLKSYICRELLTMACDEVTFEVEFRWSEKYGVPGAVIVKNRHKSEFYLKAITLENFPEEGQIHFDCKSWVYPVDKYNYNRIFFVNTPYLPEDTPPPLKPYRDEELLHLRGEGVAGQLQEWDRVYDYEYYNDLGDPDKGSAHARPVLGGSSEYPYPRRGKTGHPPTKTDPNTESRLTFKKHLTIYVPRDERFTSERFADFFISGVKSIITQTEASLLGSPDGQFTSYEDVLRLYEGGLPVPNLCLLKEIREMIPSEMIKEVLRTEPGQRLFKLPVPHVIQDNKWAWQTDEEFAREMLAGMNPIVIRRLDEFPPESKLDPSKYGNQNSSITAAHIEHDLEGLTIDQALRSSRLLILDHHDLLMVYLNRINSTENKVYASRTLMFLRDDSTLKPLAIELSLPHPDGEQYGCVSRVYTPSQIGIQGSIWQLAKAYVAVNDTGIHQLITHWLNTHAVMEPIIIATNRHLSVLHPLHKLLAPHFRDTMNINALARQTLINADGFFESSLFPAKYSMEMSSLGYKNWNFVEQALPNDLIKRGVAVKDEDGQLHLLIKDYPFAADGLAVWRAIESWVAEYCSIYYPDDETVQADSELQAWWKEVREVGHGDLKDQPWWPAMQTVGDLTGNFTIIIWVASALHAAINYSQYPYGGYIPNRPVSSRRFMPEEGTPEYDELSDDPEKVFLKTIASQLQSLIGLSMMELQSKHTSDEVYLGERDSVEWTADEEARQAFRRLGDRLRAIEAEIMARNGDRRLKNRNGAVKMAYTPFVPTSKPGITGRGIPNSVTN